jgi:hypothetical protein
MLCTLSAMGPTPPASADARSQPMTFELRLEGPADVCGKECRTLVFAAGAITADTPREFDAFVQRHKAQLRGATLALDSDGGSVLGALAFGRAVRALRLTTTVGKISEIPGGPAGEKRAKLMPRAYCESMCAFVLLAGIERYVPSDSRVLVHQIWLGDRREDPTGANYSAEDLVLVQRDIGRLAQYTVEMGGTIDLLEVALKIPPWEPMRLLSREELRGMKVVTNDQGSEVNSGTAVTTATLSNGVRAPANDRSWMLADNSGRTTITRKHPLTVEGDDIGSFELTFACGEPGKDFTVTYTERRRSAEAGRAAVALMDVEVQLSGKSIPLKITSSQPASKPLELDTVAGGRVSLDLFKAFADAASRSLTVETTSEDTATIIRVGNVGLARHYKKLLDSCSDQARPRSTELRRGG